MIASELECALFTHALMTILTQFRVGPWVNKLLNLSEGAEAAVELAQRMLQTSESYLLSMRYLACFDEYGCRFSSGTHESDKHRVLGEKLINALEADQQLKKNYSDWAPANKGNNKFKGITCKECDVLGAGGTH